MASWPSNNRVVPETSMQPTAVPWSVQEKPMPSSLETLRQCVEGENHIVRPKGVRDCKLDKTDTHNGHRGGISCLILSSDGQRLVSGSDDKLIKVWDQTSEDNFLEQSWALRGEAATLKGHSGEVYSLALSNDMRLLVSGSDKEIILWKEDGDGYRKSHIEEGAHEEEVFCLALTGDGNRLVSGSDDNKIKVWSITADEHGQQRMKFVKTHLLRDGHAHGVISLVLSRDDKRVFSCSDDNTVKIFDLETMECTATLTDHEESINTLAMCDDGRFFVSGSEDLTIRVWDIERQECTKVLRGHTDWINGIAISSDGRRLVSGDLDGCIKVWDLETGWCIRTLKGHTGEVWDVALSSDGKWLYSCSEDATIRVWDLGNGEDTMTLEENTGGDKAIFVALSKDGRQMVSAAEDEKTIMVWEMATEECIAELKGHEDVITCLALSGDGRRLVSGSQDGQVKVWNPRRKDKEACLCDLPIGSAQTIRAVAISSDGRRIISCDGPNIMVHDVDASREVALRVESYTMAAELRGHETDIKSIALSWDGRTLASGCSRSIRVWNLTEVAAEEMNCSYSQQVDLPVMDLVLSRSGRLLAACYDTTNTQARIDIWKVTGDCKLETRSNMEPVEEEREIPRDERHNKRINALAMACNGDVLVSGADDNKIKIWDLKDGKQDCIGELQGHNQRVSAVALCTNGVRLISGSYGSKYDKILRSWNVKTRQCTAILQGNNEQGVCGMVLSAGSRRLYSACYDSKVKEWNLEDGSSQDLTASLQYGRCISSVALSGNGLCLVSASRNEAQFQVWEKSGSDTEFSTASTVIPRDPQADAADFICTLAICNDGTRIACGLKNGDIAVWQRDAIPGANNQSNSITQSFARTRALTTGYSATGVADGPEANNWRQIKVLKEHNGAVTSLVLNGEGQRMISGSKDETIKVWRLSAGSKSFDCVCSQTLEGHDGPVQAIALRHDNRKIVSGATDGKLKVWDLMSGTCTNTLDADEKGVTCVVLSKNGRTAFSGSPSWKVKVWDLRSERCTSVLDGHQATIVCMALGMDGRRLFSGDAAGKIQVWDLTHSSNGCVHLGKATTTDVNHGRNRQVELPWYENVDGSTLVHTKDTLNVPVGNDEDDNEDVGNHDEDVSLEVSVRLPEKLLDVKPGYSQKTVVFYLPVSGTIAKVRLCCWKGDIQVTVFFEADELGLAMRKDSYHLKEVYWLGHLPRGRVLEAPFFSIPPSREMPCVSQNGTGLGGHVSFLHYLAWLDPVSRDKVCRKHDTSFCKAVKAAPGLRSALRAKDILSRTPLEAMLSQEESAVRPNELSDILAAYAHDAAECKRLKDVVALEQCMDCLVRCLPMMREKALDFSPVWDILETCAHVTVVESVPSTIARESAPSLGWLGFKTFVDDGSKTQWLSEEEVRMESAGGSRYNLMRFCLRDPYARRGQGTQAILKPGKGGDAQMDSVPKKTERDLFVPWDFIVEEMPAEKFGMPLARAATNHRTPMIHLGFMLLVHFSMTVCLVMLMLGDNLGKGGWALLGPLLGLAVIVFIDELADVFWEARRHHAIMKRNIRDSKDSEGKPTSGNVLNKRSKSISFLSSVRSAFFSYFGDVYNLAELGLALSPVAILVSREIEGLEEGPGTWTKVTLSLALMVCFLKYISFMRSIEYFAGIVKMMETIMVKTIPDMVFLVVLTFGFSAANHILLYMFSDYYELSYGFTLLRHFVRYILGDAGIFEVEDDPVISGLDIEEEDGMYLDKPDLLGGELPFGVFIFVNVLYVYLVVIVFLNLLIARMGSFYEDVKLRQLCETTRSCALTYENSYRRKTSYLVAAGAAALQKLKQLFCQSKPKTGAKALQKPVLARWCPCEEKPWEAAGDDPAGERPQPGSYGAPMAGDVFMAGAEGSSVNLVNRQLEKLEQNQKDQREQQRQQGNKIMDEIDQQGKILAGIDDQLKKFATARAGAIPPLNRSDSSARNLHMTLS